jgi:endoglucanase
MGKGMNTFRIPFLVERLAPSGLSGSFNQAYLSGLQTIVSYITGKGGYAIIDPHNYMRYNGNVISSSDFAACRCSFCIIPVSLLTYGQSGRT